MSARSAISAGPTSTTRALSGREALGDKVETAYLESVPEGPDAERAIERFARSGCNIIFTTSFGYMDATNGGGQVPRREVRARHRLQARAPERRDLQFAVLRRPLHPGQIAAKMSKTGVAGYIASFPIPEVVMGINAFMLGAQSVNPTSRSRSSGPTPGSTRARKPTPPRR
jgi:basic membrane protein A and related proteins